MKTTITTVDINENDNQNDDEYASDKDNDKENENDDEKHRVKHRKWMKTENDNECACENNNEAKIENDSDNDHGQKQIEIGSPIECEGWRRHSGLIFLILLFTKPNIEVSGWLYQTKTHFTHIVYQPFSRVRLHPLHSMIP